MDNTIKDESQDGKTSIFRSNPRKEIPVPKIKFEEFWQLFDTVE
jgi:hypothetical protein